MWKFYDELIATVKWYDNANENARHKALAPCQMSPMADAPPAKWLLVRPGCDEKFSASNTEMSKTFN